MSVGRVDGGSTVVELSSVGTRIGADGASDERRQRDGRCGASEHTAGAPGEGDASELRETGLVHG
jgi:hypothetical protein